MEEVGRGGVAVGQPLRARQLGARRVTGAQPGPAQSGLAVQRAQVGVASAADDEGVGEDAPARRRWSPRSRRRGWCRRPGTRARRPSSTVPPRLRAAAARWPKSAWRSTVAAQRGWGCRRAADRAVVDHDDLDVACIGELALEGGVEDRQLTGLLEVRDDDGDADVAPGAGRLDLVAHEVPAVVRHGEATGDCVRLEPPSVDHAVRLVSRV